MFGYSSWSSTRIRIPPATTTVAVAVTITLAALRTDTGSRRNRVIRRSISLGRAISRRYTSPRMGLSARVLSQCRRALLGAGRARELEDLLEREDEQHRPHADQAVAHSAKRELGADADEEQDACEDDGRADVLVGGLGGFLTVGVVGVGLRVELLRLGLAGGVVLRHCLWSGRRVWVREWVGCEPRFESGPVLGQESLRGDTRPVLVAAQLSAEPGVESHGVPDAVRQRLLEGPVCLRPGCRSLGELERRFGTPLGRRVTRPRGGDRDDRKQQRFADRDQPLVAARALVAARVVGMLAYLLADLNRRKPLGHRAVLRRRARSSQGLSRPPGTDPPGTPVAFSDAAPRWRWRTWRQGSRRRADAGCRPSAPMRAASGTRRERLPRRRSDDV